MSFTELRYFPKLRNKKRRDVLVLETLWELHDTPIEEQVVGVLPFSIGCATESWLSYFVSLMRHVVFLKLVFKR